MRWLLVLLAACDNGGSTPDWSRMIDQPKALPYGGEMRAPPAGTVRRDWQPDPGMPPITRALIERGRNRYGIVCATCHGTDGNGDSLVARNMARRKPPSLHEPRIAALSNDEVHRVIEDGYGLMPSYAVLLPPADRWAVVAYVKTLDVAWRMR